MAAKLKDRSKIHTARKATERDAARKLRLREESVSGLVTSFAGGGGKEKRKSDQRVIGKSHKTFF